jgi:toxin-antitoxin system PIN domain toxin
MRALLDVNVIIALLDPDHTFHDKAHAWWEDYASPGWASCPISENGVVRIMAGSSYSSQTSFSAGKIINLLETFVSQTNHEFWPDSLSLCDEKIFAPDRILRSYQLTDVYLLALAVKHNGRLVTFDQGISLPVVRIAKAENLLVL